MDPDAFPDVPEEIRTLLTTVPWNEPPSSDEDDQTHQLWLQVHNGCCMTCGGPLKHHTILVINHLGVCAAYCTGVCLTDMGVIGWLQEQHDDVVDKVKFRGGHTNSDE